PEVLLPRGLAGCLRRYRLSMPGPTALYELRRHRSERARAPGAPVAFPRCHEPRLGNVPPRRPPGDSTQFPREIAGHPCAVRAKSYHRCPWAGPWGVAYSRLDVRDADRAHPLEPNPRQIA